MKHLIWIMLLLVPIVNGEDGKLKIADRLNLSVSARFGFDVMHLDVPDEIKYTPAHPDDQPKAVMGAYHNDPFMTLGTAVVSTGIELRLTSQVGIEAGWSWTYFSGSSRSKEEYPPFESYTYLDTDVDTGWVAEPYIELAWTFYKDRSGRCLLSVGTAKTRDFEVEYKRGWYRWGGWQLDSVHHADVEGTLYYVKYRFISTVGAGVTFQVNRRDWETKFDTGHVTGDRGWGMALGIDFRY